MPYNNTPITPSKDVKGTAALPLARVKKIIAADQDISGCSNNAAFVITVAAEMFLQHLVEQSYNMVKSERKPRRNVQYRDVANVVARVENLEFLGDVVPKTMTYRQFKNKPAKTSQAQAPGGGVLEAGQSTLDRHGGGTYSATGEDVGPREQHTTNGASNGPNDIMDIDEEGDNSNVDTANLERLPQPPIMHGGETDEAMEEA